MTVRVLFLAPDALWADYELLLGRALASSGVSAEVLREAPHDTVDYVVFAPSGPVSDFSGFTRAKAALGLWAGVEQIVGNQTLTLPLARMVDPGLAEGMAEWVTGHVLRYHLGIDADVVNPDFAWTPRVPPLARDRTVAILGMGALGHAAANSLRFAASALYG